MSARRESWVDFYRSARAHPPAPTFPVGDELDEVGTEVFPAFEESKAPHAGLLPTCPNCGTTPDVTVASREATVGRCTECWGRLQAVSQ